MKLFKSIVKEVLYHGSDSNFDRFDLMYCGKANGSEYGHGIYLTNSIEVAYQYADGYMYYVDIPKDDGTNYIYADSPINKRQYEEIVSSMSDYEIKLLRKKVGHNIDGILLYNFLSDLIGSDEGASEYLKYCGIIGMIHQDSNDSDALSYVIFDEDAIQIIKKEEC